jgi:hypothetical protein
MGQAGVAGSPMEGWAQGDAQRNLADRLASNTSGIMMGQYGQERGYQNQAQMGMPGAVGTAYGTAGQAAGQGASNWLQSLNAQIGAAGQAGQGTAGTSHQALQAGQGLGGQVSGMINPYLQMYGLGQQQQQAEQAMANPQWTAFNQYLQQPAGARRHDQPGRRRPGDAGLPERHAAGHRQSASVGGLPPAVWASDERLKKDIEPAGLGTGFIAGATRMSRRARRATWGPMAQDVQKVAPSAVTTLNGLLAIPSALVER